jgi:hypothetical protein
MNQELEQGLKDGKYMHLAPDWGTNSNPPVERLSWPTYRQVEQHDDCGCYHEITPREAGPVGDIYTVPRHPSIIPDRGWEGSGPDMVADAYNPMVAEGSALDERADVAAMRAGGGAASIAAHEAVVGSKRY